MSKIKFYYELITFAFWKLLINTLINYDVNEIIF